MEEKKLVEQGKKEKCFVIMPISDPDGYEKGHFRQVYEDVFIPAIKEAGFIPYRADDSKCSNVIQEEIIREIIESPMAICDLSTRNPNVLFELGVRQAFDLPVVLVQEEGTERIFDIGSINTIDYDGKLTYRSVMSARKEIEDYISTMRNDAKGLNSIIKLLQVSKAEISPNSEMTEMAEIKLLLNSMRQDIVELKKKTTDKDEYVSQKEKDAIHRMEIYREYLEQSLNTDKNITKNMSSKQRNNLDNALSEYFNLVDAIGTDECR